MIRVGHMRVVGMMRVVRALGHEAARATCKNKYFGATLYCPTLLLFVSAAEAVLKIAEAARLWCVSVYVYLSGSASG